MAPAGHPKLAVFGKYELREYLGGNMADVFRALDSVTGKTVAVKILKPQFAADPEMKARFLDEARMSAPLQHPNLVDVFDFGEVEGRTFIVMEYLSGEDLRSAIVNDRTGDLVYKLRVMLQVADAMEYIHSQGITHRDLKPENIRIDSSGVVRLIDFGIAKSETAIHKTQVGVAVGTPLYMAPEQIMGEGTKLVDVYAFSMVLYELLTSRKAVKGMTDEQICFFVLHEKLNLEPLKDEFPAPVLDLISRCAEKDPARRIQDFGQIRCILEQIIGSLTQGAPTVRMAIRPPGRAGFATAGGRKLWAYSGIAVAAAAAIGVAVWLAWPKPRIDPPPAETPVIVKPRELSKVLPDPAGDMVLVPGGPFLFGKNKEPHTLPDFYIDRTEVSNAAFARYARAKDIVFKDDHPELPVVNVLVFGTSDFCEWAGKRLPSMYEWEKAARGTDGREFPWGNQIEPWRANVADNRKLRKHGLMPVLSFVNEGASPYGAVQMAGNVWEFVSDKRPATPEERRAANFPGDPAAEWSFIYGGSYKGPLAGVENARSWDNSVAPPDHKDSATGFRCAKTP